MRRVWRTKDKRELLISSMTNKHVLNAISFCKRRGFIGTFPNITMFQGEMAQMAAEHDWDERLSRYLPELEWLEDEAERRGLK